MQINNEFFFIIMYFIFNISDANGSFSNNIQELIKQSKNSKNVINWSKDSRIIDQLELNAETIMENIINCFDIKKENKKFHFDEEWLEKNSYYLFLKYTQEIPIKINITKMKKPRKLLEYNKKEESCTELFIGSFSSNEEYLNSFTIDEEYFNNFKIQIKNILKEIIKYQKNPFFTVDDTNLLKEVNDTDSLEEKEIIIALKKYEQSGLLFLTFNY